MNNDELKKKIVDIALHAEWTDMFGDHNSIGKYAANAIADALIAAGIGDVKTVQHISASATALAVLDAAKAENAAVRARLDNAVELKYDVGDTVYLIQRTPDYPNGTILETIVRDVEVRKNKNGTFLNYYTELDNTYFSISEAEINVFAFTDKAAAETRLAELKGGNE